MTLFWHQCVIIICSLLICRYEYPHQCHKVVVFKNHFVYTEELSNETCQGKTFTQYTWIFVQSSISVKEFFVFFIPTNGFERHCM